MSDEGQDQDKWLRPADVAAYDRNQVAFAKCVATLVIVGPTAMAFLIWATEGPERLVGLIPFVVTGIGGLYLLNSGRAHLAFQTLTYGVWASAVNALFWTHGLTGTTLGAVLVTLAFAGWLAGATCAIILTAATPPVIYLLAYLEDTGWPISIGADVTPYQRALAFSLTAVGAGVLGYFGAASLRDRLNRLQQSEKRYASVFNTVPDAIAVTRRSDSTHLDLNSASEKLLGYPRERLLGRTALDLGIWADLGERTELLSRLDRDGRVANFSSRFVRADGQPIDVLVSAVPYDFLGDPCIIWSWSDISKLRAAEREAQFRQRIESIMLDVSSRFLNAGDGDIDTIILDSLTEIGKFAEADRCFINLLDAQAQRYSLSHEWCADGIDSKRAARQNVPVAMAGAMWEQTARNEVMYVAVAELPADSAMRSMLEGSGIKSSLAVPIVSGGHLIGCLAFDAVRQARRWTDSVVVLMRIAADILGGMIAQRRAAGAINAAAQRLQIALEGSQISVWETDLRTNQIWLDASWAALLGKPRAETRSNTLEMLDVVHPEDRQAAVAAAVRVHKGEIASYSVEQRVRTASGEWRWILSRGRVVERDATGRPLRISGTNTDITERKQADAKLHLAASVFTHAREGILITYPDGTIIDVNDTFSHITGYSRDEVLGRNPRILSSGRQSREFFAAMWRDLIEHGHWSGEVWNRRKNGEVYAEMLTISAVRDAHGNTLQYVALFFDITASKEHEAQLEHIAHYDALTGLPNRALLADRLQQAMAQAHRRAQPLAVAYLDLDNFKAVNDLHGHSAGDQLLVTMASRMKQTLREGDTLSRLGGDEFVAVLLDLPDVQASVPMLARLLAAAAKPVPVKNLVLEVSASVGVTFYPQAEDVDADQLLRQADQAMYQAKLAGKNRYHVFDAEQDRSVRGHHESLERIRRAHTDGEFVLHYQPKVNMRTGVVIGAEALIRWEHPEKGLLLPAVFLPVIEDHPLAVEIGEWVIDTTLTQMGR